MIFQSLPCRFWSSLLLKQRYKILLFCGSCDLEITSSQKDSTTKTVGLWSWRLDLTNVFQRGGFFKLKIRLKNLLIRLYEFSLLYQNYKNKISWNSRSGNFKLPFDNTMSVNKNMFRFNKTTLKSTIINVCSRLLCWLWSWVSEQPHQTKY